LSEIHYFEHFKVALYKVGDKLVCFLKKLLKDDISEKPSFSEI